MCLIGEAMKYAGSRRTFLKSAGLLAAAPLAGGLVGKARATPSPRVLTDASASGFNTRLVLLGTAGGPTWWPPNPQDPDRDPRWINHRASASSALIVGDAMYLVDLGHGSALRLAEAFSSGEFVNGVQKGYPTFLSNLKAVFFTHLHQDHTADYPSLLLCGHGAGIYHEENPQPVKVVGPGNRRQLEADIYNFQVPVVNPWNPTPGTWEMTHYLWQAYAQTINDFTRDNGWPDFTRMFDVQDVWLPPDLPGFVSPNETPCVAMEPFQIYQDENVVVQATLVDHHQVFPSFAFRFDTPDGSVVFSGDTGPDTKGNLPLLARGADILVHEVIDEAWIDLTFGQAEERTPMDEALVIHLRTAHTPIEEVGKVAEQAGVETLVLNHIVPGNAPIAHLLQAKRHFSGDLVVGEDLMRVGVGAF